MRILLHVCCGPCTVYPLRRLREQGHRVSCFFYNPNIHPFQEFRRRLDAVRQLAEAADCPMEIDERYGLTEYLRRVVFHEAERCSRCYDLRLAAAAVRAAAGGFDAFSSTLLYSKYQNHRLLDTLGGQLAAANGVGWYYEDFRQGWQEGIDESIRLGLYRQPYCGCIYSEQERYDKRLRNRKG
ncbi:epoxyqueuosine reductase QueH [Desulfobulbus sp.]|uniref:epoxyqueuosine reductase QueH n=1 Tax=Desulfobulbus sp. TaxID=895 RepID=UPI00286F555D|nr:epoxyqueuosine reductase QueH [Desulfobulbus sp.]